ncbi:MAG: transketolase [Defluviitaleaceae bacterium]|nr:transketolase [Defluviitaleaceae bacterium]
MNLETKTINTLRMLSVDMIQAANSGHPGLPLGLAPTAYTLWAKHLKHDPKNPNWQGRDRFVLSAGHGSALLYSLLHVFGYDLSLNELKNFRQMGSETPGHPEYGHTKGVEVTTGPLGQGIASAVGMAIAEEHLAAKFNKPNLALVNNYTYVACGDGCLQEGVSSEALSLAGALGLSKLIVLYDSNNITIEGNTNISFTEDVRKRFEAYEFDTFFVKDGNDIEEINNAIEAAKKSPRPALIEIKTQIGYGAPKAGTAGVHGEPLGKDGLKTTKQYFGFDVEKSFNVDEDVYNHARGSVCDAKERYTELLEKYKTQFPEDYALWLNYQNMTVPDFLNNEDYWNYSEDLATRQSGEVILNKLAELVPNLIGGSADLSPSTKTVMKNRESFLKNNKAGSNMHFGIREHGMAAIANGMFLYGGLRPYIAGFFVFSDYKKAALRLSALMQIPVISILTHDSIGVGEDGPTHQPIEQLASLRSIPGYTVFRPADTKETAAAYAYALQNQGPTAIVLTRQKTKLLAETGKEALKGGYILRDSENPEIILIATGSEVELAYDAYDELAEKGISARVVSIPSFEVFEKQSAEYKESILPKSIRTRLAIEAGSPFGLHKYVGLDGDVIAMENFGDSGPAEEVFKKYGFTVGNVVEKSLQLLDK